MQAGVHTSFDIWICLFIVCLFVVVFLCECDAHDLTVIYLFVSAFVRSFSYLCMYLLFMY